MAEKHHVPAQINDFNPGYLLFLSTLAYIAAVIITLVGGIVFSGWVLRIFPLVSWTGTIYMRTNAGLCFLFSGLALILLLPENTGPLRLWVGRICALAVLVIAGITLSEHIFGWNLGIDQLIAIDVVELQSVVSPNRMGLPSSTCFTFAGLALIILGFRVKRINLLQWFGAAIFVIAMLPTIGYLYGVQKFYGIARYTGIAPITAVALLILAIAIICSRPREGLIAMLAADDPGGAVIRRFLIPVILIPLLLGYLQVLGERHEHFDTATGTATLMLVMIISFIALLWFNAKRISSSTAADARPPKACGKLMSRLNRRFVRGLSSFKMRSKPFKGK